MQPSFSQIVKDALENKIEDFIKVVDDAFCLLSNENGYVRNFKIVGKLVKLKPKGEALIIGDLHGDLESLIGIMKESNFFQRISQKRRAFLVFLGDYGDRGEHSTEIYYTILKLKLLFPNQVILLRGNHEGPEDLSVSPHDLPIELQTKFGEKWTKAYSHLRKLFSCLYNTVIVEERYLLIHGGIPQQAQTINDLAYAHALHPKQSFLEEMLWSDPDDMVKETCASPRGAGKLFGKSVTDEALRKFNVKIMIRGHEPCDIGFKSNHGGKVLTLFSRKGPPYFNSYGAYLDLNLEHKFENADQLIPYIHKF